MRVGVEPQLQILIPLFRFPDRGERQKETLLGREAVDFLRACAGIFIERLLQCRIGELDSAQVGDVFALSQLAIHMQSRQRLVFAVLLHDCA